MTLSTPYPLGVTLGGDGANFAVYSETADAVDVCTFDEDGAETRTALERAHRPRLPRLRRRAPASAPATGCASTARGTRTRACATTRTSCCSTRTPPRSRATYDVGRRRVFGHDWTSPSSATTPTRPAHVPAVRRHRPRLRLGRRRARRAPRSTETVVYEVHVKGFTQRHPEVPEEIRGTYAGLAPPGGHQAPHRPRRDRGRAAARAPVRAGQPPRGEGAAQLLGLQLHRLLRPARRVRRGRRRPAARSPSSRRW